MQRCRGSDPPLRPSSKIQNPVPALVVRGTAQRVGEKADARERGGEDGETHGYAGLYEEMNVCEVSEYE